MSACVLLLSLALSSRLSTGGGREEVARRRAWFFFPLSFPAFLWRFFSDIRHLLEPSVKALHARYRDWADSDLKQIPILPEGSRLEQNATYIDLAAAEPDEFTATGGMAAGSSHWYVPKSEVPF